jgi:transcriptional regulator with XRE-family HTH domain
MGTKRLPISEQRVLGRVVSYGMKAPDGIASLQLHHVIVILRHGLGMTQAQLARRAGLVQSHVAEIELGHVDLQFSTLSKIFHALHCNPLVLPVFEKKPEAIIAERAKETAKRKIARVAGSMALEKQLPDARTTQKLIREEEQRLRKKPASEIWEE